MKRIISCSLIWIPLRQSWSLVDLGSISDPFGNNVPQIFVHHWLSNFWVGAFPMKINVKKGGSDSQTLCILLCQKSLLSSRGTSPSNRQWTWMQIQRRKNVIVSTNRWHVIPTVTLDSQCEGQRHTTGKLQRHWKCSNRSGRTLQFWRFWNIHLYSIERDEGPCYRDKEKHTS